MILNLDIQKDFFNTSEILSILGSPTRIKLLQFLTSDKQYTISELAKAMGQGISNVSQQIQILEDCGIVKKIKKKDGSTRKFIDVLYDEVVIKL